MIHNNSSQQREHWTGSLGFILAGVGSAVGLGNIWKFPYITGTNGGGAFILIYLICIVLIGLPLMMCELAIGRKTQKNPFGAFQMLAPHRSVASNGFALAMLALAVALLSFKSFGTGIVLMLGALAILRWGWSAIGALGVIIPVLILSYYIVVGGWTLIYAWESLFGRGDLTSVESAGAHFNEVIFSWRYAVGGMIVFGAAILAVVWFGVRKGIERVSKLLMPLLFVMLIALILRGITLPGSAAGVHFLLNVDFSKLTGTGVLAAVGHSFFTLSLGMGIVMTYGSYLPPERNILSASCWIVLMDTLVALLAGLAIFPALFAGGGQPAEGPGLLFHVMPPTLHSFGDSLGWLWCFMLFLCIAIAAVTSAISLLEVPVAFCMDQWKWPRRRAVISCLGVIFTLGIFSAVSIGNWNRLLALRELLANLLGEQHIKGNFFDQLDTFCSDYLLPISGFLTVIFCGYVWKTRNCLQELRRGGDNLWDTNILILLAGLRGDSHLQERKYIYTPGVMFGVLIRVIVPAAIIVCFMNLMKWIDVI